MYFEGERSANVVFDQSIYGLLIKTQPAILERLQKIIAKYPDGSMGGDAWNNLHDGVIGTNPQKNAVHLKLDREIIIMGEIVDELDIGGVLFTKSNFGTVYPSLTATLDFDAMGRPIINHFLRMQLGAKGSEESRAKYVNSKDIAVHRDFRGSLPVTYAVYENPKNPIPNPKSLDNSLGVFVSAHRKNAPERASFTIDDFLERPDGFEDLQALLWIFSKSLRELDGYIPDQPHYGNVAIDPTGQEPPIWYDVGGWMKRDTMTTEQAAAYRYAALSKALSHAFAIMDRGAQKAIEFVHGYKTYHTLFAGYFHDAMQNKHIQTGVRRIDDMYEDKPFLPSANRNLLDEFIVNQDLGFGMLDLVDSQASILVEDVMPMHRRGAPFFSFLYDLERGSWMASQ